MPPKLKRLSGKEVIQIYQNFGFSIHSQKGSHVKIRRVISNKEKQTLTIPLHKEMDRGTLKAIFRQSTKYILESELKIFFYSK